MAIYHCSVKIIGRNAGRSAVAAAAYRSGEKIVNEYDGIEHNFTKKNWIEYTDIILPKHAPNEYQERGKLWNAVELAEKTSDAQLAREFELALPIEFSREQQIEVVEAYVRDNFTSQGMIADIAIHNPPKTNDRHQAIDKDGNVTRDVNEMQFVNPHAHILCTVRPMNEFGKWEKKSEVEYLCKKDGKEKAFTALEFQTAKEEGWEKQYRYIEDGKKVCYTPSEARGKELERVNRTPKTTAFGRKNEMVEQWDSKEQIVTWRKNWASAVNDKFASIHSDTRIDSRSFKAQGQEDEIPTLHMGVAAINMEKRADREIREGKSEADIARSDIGDINRQIKEYNSFLQRIVQKTKEMIVIATNKLEELRARIKRNKCEKEKLISRQKKMEADLVFAADTLQKYQTGVITVEEVNRKVSEDITYLQEELKKCSLFQAKRRVELQNRIKELQEEILYRNQYKERMEQQNPFKSREEYRLVIEGHEKKREEFKKLEAEIDIMSEEEKQLLKEYQFICSRILVELKADVFDKVGKKEDRSESYTEKHHRDVRI